MARAGQRGRAPSSGPRPLGVVGGLGEPQLPCGGRAAAGWWAARASCAPSASSARAPRPPARPPPRPSLHSASVHDDSVPSIGSKEKQNQPSGAACCLSVCLSVGLPASAAALRLCPGRPRRAHARSLPLQILAHWTSRMSVGRVSPALLAFAARRTHAPSSLRGSSRTPLHASCPGHGLLLGTNTCPTLP